MDVVWSRLYVRLTAEPHLIGVCVWTKVIKPVNMDATSKTTPGNNKHSSDIFQAFMTTEIELPVEEDKGTHDRCYVRYQDLLRIL